MFRIKLGAATAAAIGIICAAAAPATFGNAFAFGCDYTHSLPDDPIVFPGQPGASHLHDFIGNYSTDAYSTPDSLRTASTPCVVRGDGDAVRSAYWFPAILVRQDDLSLKPAPAKHATIYYEGDDATEPFPDDIGIVAGVSGATSAQSTYIVRWSCINGIIVDVTRPECGPDPSRPWTPNVRLEIRFPQCWDGVTPTSGHNYTFHMTYKVTGHSYCPTGYPHKLPQIHMFVSFGTAGGPDADQFPTLPGAVKLSSGGQYSAHGDFLTGWDPLKLELLVETCIRHPVVKCT